MGHYSYAWEYRVAPGNEAAFLERYRPDGAWVQLFRRADGYIETWLLKDRAVEGRYVTVDRWESAEAFEAFRRHLRADYEALDRECEGLTAGETPIGSFTEVDSSATRGPGETGSASPPAEGGHGDVTLHLLGPGDAALLGRVADDVFDYAVDPHLTAEFLDDPRHHMAIAIDDGTVVGMASAVDYVHPDKPRELWINEVAVAPTHRRSGIARRMLELLFERGRECGCREAWVGTEHENVAARALYQGLGGEEGAFVLYSFRLED